MEFLRRLHPAAAARRDAATADLGAGRAATLPLAAAAPRRGGEAAAPGADPARHDGDAGMVQGSRRDAFGPRGVNGEILPRGAEMAASVSGDRHAIASDASTAPRTAGDVDGDATRVADAMRPLASAATATPDRSGRASLTQDLALHLRTSVAAPRPPARGVEAMPDARPATAAEASAADPALGALASPGPLHAALRAPPRAVLSAGAQPLAAASRDAAPPPVHVTIDRIDVRVAAPAAPPGAPRKPRAAPSGGTLADYLRGRPGGGAS